MEGKETLKGVFLTAGFDRTLKMFSGGREAKIVYMPTELPPMPRFLGLAFPSNVVTIGTVFPLF